ncbi:MAG: GerMN domain-containing protein [Ilumatobacter sp.]|uniref:GerMN domain-containing protein n=1 Tax=Ilumatobacter sp. TaxID=1967498 RepID=UPI00391C117A
MLRRRGQRSPISVGAIVVGLGLLLASCATDADTTTPAASNTTATSTATTVAEPSAPATTAASDDTVVPTEATTTQPSAANSSTIGDDDTMFVNVYWGWSVLNPASGAPERLGAGGRDVAADSPIQHALEETFAGPTSVEAEIGMTSSVPAGTTLLGVVVEGDTATVDLSGEFTASGGTLDETMRLAQVVFAVTQFDGIDRVAFRIDGIAQTSMLSHGFESADGFSRDDFSNVRPAILIELPTPGVAVTDPFVIRGESNTFEATVRYAITSGGGDGIVVAEGFATATNGNGAWGDFEIVVDLGDVSLGDEATSGSIIMWEDSAQDASQLDIVEVPVLLPRR